MPSNPVDIPTEAVDNADMADFVPSDDELLSETDPAIPTDAEVDAILHGDGPIVDEAGLTDWMPEAEAILPIETNQDEAQKTAGADGADGGYGGSAKRWGDRRAIPALPTALLQNEALRPALLAMRSNFIEALEDCEAVVYSAILNMELSKKLSYQDRIELYNWAGQVACMGFAMAGRLSYRSVGRSTSLPLRR